MHTNGKLVADIDLVAIRARDQGWTDRGRRVDSTGRDRRALLDYIDELESLMVEIAADVKVIKRVHREHYLPKPVPATPPVDPSEQTQASKGLRDFRESQASGKLPP